MSARDLVMAAAGDSGGDPYFSSVSLLLHGDGTNGANNSSPVDISTNSLTINKFGSPNLSTLSPFSSGSSTYFNGSSYLTTTGTGSFNTGGTWTIEAWCYFTSSGNNDIVVNGLDGDRLYLNYFGTTLYIGDAIINNLAIANAKPVNQWFHLAVVKNGSTYTCYIDGVVKGTSTTALTTTTLTSWQIGGRTSQGAYAQGYISDLRMTTTAVYTAAFTRPSASLTAITGTAFLLSAQQNVLDSSNSKIPITTVGDAQISTAVKKYGTGSLYFDGTGDALTLSSSTAFGFGANNFTIECWVYGNFAGAYYTVLDTRVSSAVGCGVYTGTGGALTFTNNGAILIQAGSIPVNTWTHIACVRNGTTVTAYINGAAVGTATDSRTYTSAGATIGQSAVASQFFAGYIDELRITKDVARYTANFTPPTAAFPDK